ncbi:hypothetical protein CYMTET_38742 [Cymbomonas tetramitiformis]|uniref:Uncharacterized protein n=1 Tax=Cymbomonas tetramitiformis TaxID=36881 RepID=A0AAE0CBF6_9CHLO|nr:hypothetical protein CYMTET_38742 [Cymbomonas tetramitiformis]
MKGTLSIGAVVDALYLVDPSSKEVPKQVTKPAEDIEQYMVMPQQGIAMRLYDNAFIVWDSEYAHSVSEPLLEGIPITSKERGDTSNEHTKSTNRKVLRLRGGAAVASRGFATLYHKKRTRNAYAAAQRTGDQVPRRDQNRLDKNKVAHNRRAARRLAAQARGARVVGGGGNSSAGAGCSQNHE